MIFKIRCRRVD